MSNNLASIAPSRSQLYLGKDNFIVITQVCLTSSCVYAPSTVNKTLSFRFNIIRISTAIKEWIILHLRGRGGGGWGWHTGMFFLTLSCTRNYFSQSLHVYAWYFFSPCNMLFSTHSMCMIHLFDSVHYAWTHFGTKSPTPPQESNGLHLRVI